MPDLIYWIILGVSAIGLGIVGFVIGLVYRKKSTENTIGSAKEEARRILNEAIKNAETKKKESLLEAKDEIHQLRQETEKDLRERRSEIQRQEHRLQQKEESLDRKVDNLEAKEEKLAEKNRLIDEKMEECEQLKRSQLEILERISGFSKEQAKSLLLEMLESDLSQDKAVIFLF